MPPRDRKFVNPLTQASSTTETATATSTFTSPPPQHRKRGKQAFEQTHERITLWLDKGLKAQFDALADDEGAAKSTLLDEAITDLLEKYKKAST